MAEVERESHAERTKPPDLAAVSALAPPLHECL
jgi:hypothetical protein